MTASTALTSPVLTVLAVLTASTVLAQSPAVPPGSSDPRIAQIVAAPSAQRIEADIRRLVAFGTRHTMSDTLSETRGIGAARRWIRSEFDRISAACNGCLETRFVGEMVQGGRIATPTNVVSVIAIQRGASDTGRVVVMTGHFDSRNSNGNDFTGDSPGANDDGSGTAAVIEAARVLTRHRFAATIIYATLAGEEQGLNGGQIVARWVRDMGYRMEGNLNNDIVGNTSGGDGVRGDDRTLRIFSDGVPPTEFDSAAIRRRRTTGGDVDGTSRQLARYVQMIARRHIPALDVWLIYRLDRFGRGGDHTAFANLGFPAIRITEAHENYTRQHQNPRVENDTSYGDVADSVNFRYVAKVVALNATSLASLAWAPAPPRMARISGGGRYAATVTWQPPEDSANVAKYRVYWRRTDSPTWGSYEDVGMATRYVATGRVIDNWFFGVASVSRDGHESTVVFPLPGN